MDIVALLYEQAREIAKEGHAGWGNTMVLAAEEIEKLRASQQSVHADPPPAPVCECGSLYGVHEEFCPKFKSAGR